MTSRPLRVLYDISCLGLAFRWNAARTGVARVVENTARSLQGRQTCQLTLAAFESPRRMNEVADYVARGNVLDPTALWVHPVHRAVYSPFGKLANALEPGPLATMSKAIRRVAFEAGAALERIVPSLPEQLLARADVVHATERLDSLPRRRPDVARFFTVYDMLHLQAQGATNLPSDLFTVCISEFVRTELHNQLGFPEGRSVVIPLAADTKLFHRVENTGQRRAVLDRLGIGPRGYVLCVNTVVPRKNLKAVLLAFSTMKRRLAPGIQAPLLVLAGVDGSAQASREVSDWVRTCQLGSDVLRLGYVSDRDLAPLYSGALCFITLSKYEGFGLPALEAMQCGAPTLSSNAASLPEVVGEAGVLLDPDDVNAASEALTAIVECANLRADLSARSLKRASEFSWQRTGDLLLDAYREGVRRTRAG